MGLPLNVFDPNYFRHQQIAALTAQQEAVNANAAATYKSAATDWQQETKANGNVPRRPAPVPPLKIHVDQETGQITSGPDRVAEQVVPLQVAIVPSSDQIAAAGPGVSPSNEEHFQRIEAMLGAIWGKLNS